MLRLTLTPLLLLCGLLVRAQAVVVAGTKGTDGSAAVAPADDFGFANVARVFDTADNFYASGIYLGDGWVISAYHVVRLQGSTTAFSFGDVQLGGSSYAVDPNSAVRLINPSGIYAGQAADIALFRLTTVPVGLPSVTISASINLNTSVIIAGNGLGRAATGTQWDINTATNPDTWTETAGAGTRHGFKEVGPQVVQWGTNAKTFMTSDLVDAFGSEEAGFLFRTLFDENNGEAQAGDGDSGGGIFMKRGGTQWELYGLMLEVGTFDGQPAKTAVFGDATYAVALYNYQAQIASIIPEPGTASLLLPAALFALRRPRRRMP